MNYPKGGRFNPIRILIVTNRTDKWERNLGVVLNLENTTRRCSGSFVTYRNPMFEVDIAPSKLFCGRRYDNIVIDCKVTDEYVKTVLRPMLYHAGDIQYVGLSNVGCALEIGCMDTKIDSEYLAEFE